MDLRDVATLSGAGVGVAAIAAFLKGVRPDVLLAHLGALSAALERRTFQDSLKGVYTLDARAFSRLAERTQRLVLELREALHGEGASRG